MVNQCFLYIILQVTALTESIEGENNCRTDVMINIHENYVANLGFELAIPGLALRHITNCAMEAGIQVKILFLFCVEILQPSQPNGVMSSTVSLLNYTFNGHA